MAIRAKFYIATITRHASGAMNAYAQPVPIGEVVMRPVSRGGDDNEQWASATPSGEFKMSVRGEALPWFEERLGKDVSILIDDFEA